MRRTNILLLLAAAICGCSATSEHILHFSPAEPLRVAVLPFATVGENGELMDQESRLLIDNIGIVSQELDETPAQIVRREVLAQLEHTNLDVLPVALIDIELPHHGFGLPDGRVHLERLYRASARELCEELLSCDAVLFGRVTDWERSYYGLETVNTVGVELQLRSAMDNRVLFGAREQDSESRGLSGGPTGLSSLVVEPIRGLDSDIIADLAREVVQRAIAPLRISERPEFLLTPPPAIYASSHDAIDGRIPPNQPLIVVMYATPKQRAALRIGEEIRVPMIERSPGHYYGEYLPLERDNFIEQPVYTQVTDRFGRTTELAVSKGPVSRIPHAGPR